MKTGSVAEILTGGLVWAVEESSVATVPIMRRTR